MVFGPSAVFVVSATYTDKQDTHSNASEDSTSIHRGYDVPLQNLAVVRDFHGD